MKKNNSILLTNDDGIDAPGMRALFEELQHDFTVTVVAPLNEHSGTGHSFTYRKPLRVDSVRYTDTVCGYAVSGTPADCVKVALATLIPQKPDLVISGINDGVNAGVAGYYSGTVAAAREGAFWHVPSVAFSLSTHGLQHMSLYAKIAKRIIVEFQSENFQQKMRNRLFFNVNFPKVEPGAVSGILFTRQSQAYFSDTYTVLASEGNRVEYRLEGDLTDIERSIDYDVHAVEQNYIAITPLQIDATAHECVGAECDLTRILKM